MLVDSQDTRHGSEGNELSRLLAAHSNIHIQILPWADCSEVNSMKLGFFSSAPP